MTWPKAAPVLIVAVVFDGVRVFFEFFWFFGPALAALYCTIKASATVASLSFGLLGTKTAALVCSAGAAAVGAVGVEVTAPLGVVMAMAVGFAGWLTLGGWMMISNARIFKENGVWFVASLAVSEVPLLGAVPALSLTLWRMFGRQIKIERAAFRKYTEEQRAIQLQEQRQRIAQAAQIQAGQERADVEQRRIIEREEADYAEYQQRLAANDGQYEIPEDEQKAA